LLVFKITQILKILISKNWYLNIEYLPAFARYQTGP
jgi:hypothetical protein